MVVVIDVEVVGATGRDFEGVVDGVVEEFCLEAVVELVVLVELVVKMLAIFILGG